MTQGTFPHFIPSSTFSCCLSNRVDLQSLQLQLEGISVSVSDLAATLANALPIWDLEFWLFHTLVLTRHQYRNALFYEANKLKLSFHILWKDKKLLLFLQNHIKQKATATRVLLTLLNENQSIAVENTLGRTASIRGKERLKTSLLYNLGKECERMGLKKGLIEG